MIYLIALIALMFHLAFITFLVAMKQGKWFGKKARSNLIAIYSIYLIVMFGYMLDNLFFNILTPEKWGMRFLEVFISPIDNLASVIVACIVRGLFGKLEEV